MLQPWKGRNTIWKLSVLLSKSNFDSIKGFRPFVAMSYFITAQSYNSVYCTELLKIILLCARRNKFCSWTIHLFSCGKASLSSVQLHFNILSPQIMSIILIHTIFSYNYIEITFTNRKSFISNIKFSTFLVLNSSIKSILEYFYHLQKKSLPNSIHPSMPLIPLSKPFSKHGFNFCLHCSIHFLIT